MKIPFKWEIINKKEMYREWIDVTVRAKVIGGWLVRHSGASTYQDSHTNKIEYATESSMTFIPDPDHQWEIE